jgi:hypothetical protein
VTRPKLPPHRLGFSEQRDRTAADVQVYARWIFLRYVARLAPAVLRELANVPPRDEVDDIDEQALSVWARPWNLTDSWCLAYARSTWRVWQKYPTAVHTYWCDRDDVKGKLYKPRPGLQAPRPLKNPEHFEQLARYQVLGEPYRQHRKACQDLARLLGLTLRPAEQGWTRRNRQRKAAQ